MELTYDDYTWDWRGFHQRNLTPTMVYDRDYLSARYLAIEDRVIALAEARLRVLEGFVRDRGRLLDFGCGTGKFHTAAQKSWTFAAGCDIVPGSASCDYCQGHGWDAVTFFDSLEHVPAPDVVVRELAPKWVMISVPECHHPRSRDWFMSWKHRRPGEHLWHWNRDTLDKFFRGLGYRPVMHSNFEDEFRPRYDPELPNILTAIYRSADPLADPLAGRATG